jgi:predicted DNA binding CopG/RHH family protein
MEAKMRKPVKLDKPEQDIEKRLSEYVPVRGTKRTKIEQLLQKAKKTRNINIRINELDLAKLRKKAENEGIPYQTLISSVLHKFVSERLVDQEDILKSIELLEAKG